MCVQLLVPSLTPLELSPCFLSTWAHPRLYHVTRACPTVSARSHCVVGEPSGSQTSRLMPVDLFRELNTLILWEQSDKIPVKLRIANIEIQCMNVCGLDSIIIQLLIF